ncbi:MAG: ATP-binding cassette domain-containing protein [Lachnospiraceae bacterium]|jgi:peptide/nickel transport system ATP-binding protein|nr:ATP-binding cassette domain-containing protein [Lachnospiraceae bacterium]
MVPVIEIKDLAKYFSVPAGKNLAVDGVSLKIERGKTMGVVGESGCGKSTLGRTIIRLYEPTSGQILLNGEDVSHAKGAQLKKARENMQIIFQDPYSSLNPRMTVEETVSEPLEISHKYKSKAEIMDKMRELFHRVGIDKRYRLAYPHEMDGGRRQRVGIARAIALNPEFVMCDEPVSALDVSVQAQVLNLLMDLQEQYQLTYMFVTHDLSVVKHISDHISVMYLGQLVETSPSKELFANPLHPYTKALLSAIPSIDIHRPMQRKILKGELTSAINPKPGCRFAPRCEFATESCSAPQGLQEVGTDHFVSCCRINEI